MDGTPLKSRCTKNDPHLFVDMGSSTSTKRTVYVHKLIAELFVKNPNIRKYDKVEHINGDHSFNDAINLRWTNQGKINKRDIEKGIRRSGHVAAAIMRSGMKPKKFVYYVLKSKLNNGLYISKFDIMKTKPTIGFTKYKHLAKRYTEDFIDHKKFVIEKIIGECEIEKLHTNISNAVKRKKIFRFSRNGSVFARIKADTREEALQILAKHKENEL